MGVTVEDRRVWAVTGGSQQGGRNGTLAAIEVKLLPRDPAGE